MRKITPSMNLLWLLVAVLVLARLTNILFAVPGIIPLTLLAAAFALIHGALRYRWVGVLTFFVISLVVSNVLENVSILTGFPFGHYHYTASAGPRLPGAAVHWCGLLR